MSRDKAFLLDIFQAGNLVLNFAEGIERDDLEKDQWLVVSGYMKSDKKCNKLFVGANGRSPLQS